MQTLTTLLQPRRFLLLAGTVLTVIGLAGVTCLLGHISHATLFNPPYWINWVHLTFGIFVFAIAFAGVRTIQNGMTLAAGILGSTLGLLGLLVSVTLRLRLSRLVERVRIR